MNIILSGFIVTYDIELIQDPGDSRINGFVQYCLEGEWGRVRKFNGHMDVSEAAVACRHLLYSTGEIVRLYTPETEVGYKP